MVIINAAVFFILFLITITDLLFYEIKNQHVISLLLLNTLQLFLLSTFNICSILIIILAFVLLIFLCNKNLIGGGDVKLVLVLMVGLSPEEIYNFLIYMSFVGGGEVIIFLIFSKSINKIRKMIYKIVKHKIISKILFSINQKLIIVEENSYLKMEIPYGISICIGFMLSRI